MKLFIALFFLKLSCCAFGYVTVQTGHGSVTGYSLDISGYNVVGSDISSINMFLGIPYAEPPIGNLRFARPVPKRPWSPKRLEAFQYSAACPQPTWFLRTYSFNPDYNNTDEDCLYLNIYAPYNSVMPDKKYPVLFWIHGGSYKYGSGAEYDGRILAQEGVIVVTINYRLGVMGFLSTDDEVAPGNYGLLDQLMALKWIKDNIIHFNGDPDKITLFGQSAGGGSVSLHLFSPLAKGLFNSVIPQSGCALSPWAIYRPPHKVQTYTKSLARSVGCTTRNSVDMISCLRSKDANLLTNLNIEAPPMISTFAPRVDGYYIHDLPEVLLERRNYLHSINTMTGFLPNEVSEDYEDIPGIDQGLSKKQLEQLFYTKSRRFLANADDVYSALLCAYEPSSTNYSINRDLFINMNSDYGYVVPHLKLSEKLWTGGENVWLYEFTYRSQNTNKKEWIGVPHAEELYYQFGAPFLDDTPCPGIHEVTCPVKWGKYQPWSNVDKHVSLLTINLWAAFAKLAPNETNFSLMGGMSKNWPTFLPGENILIIGELTEIEHFSSTRGVRFWNSFNYLNISAPVPDTCLSKSETLVGK